MIPVEWVIAMTDQEFADWLKSVPRERTWEEVELLIMERDRERGPYIPHGQNVHHSTQESRH